MKDIRVKPARQAYICPGCHRRINIDIETIQMRSWSPNLCNDEIACGEVLAKNVGNSVRAIIEPKPQIYCDECSVYYDPIDWDIADLVYLMQRLDIATVGSCSGHGGELCYDGIDEIRSMMKEMGRNDLDMYVSAYVTFKNDRGAAELMKTMIRDFAAAHSCCEEKAISTGDEVFRVPITLDDHSLSAICFYTHNTKRYGGHETRRSDDCTEAEVIPYAEISFTYFCNDITSMTEKSAQSQMVDLIGNFVCFVQGNISDYNWQLK